MPYCRARARLTDRDAEEGKITKRKAEAALREQGWSKRDPIGWTCGNHTGHERRKLKKWILEDREDKE